jgi:hypothetical protein
MADARIPSVRNSYIDTGACVNSAQLWPSLLKGASMDVSLIIISHMAPGPTYLTNNRCVEQESCSRCWGSWRSATLAVIDTRSRASIFRV